MSIQKTFSVSAKMRGCLQHKGATRKRKKKGVKKKKKKKNKSGCFVWQRVGMDHHTEPCNSFLTRQLIVWERLFCSFICVKMGFSYSLWTQKAIVWKPNRKKKTTTIRAYLTKGWKKNVVLAGPQYENEGGNQPRQKVTAKKKKREVVVRPYVYIYW